MSEVTSGYSALSQSAAWLDISWRGKIRATGADRVRFIQAMCSNDVERLKPGGGTYAFFLNVQGRIQADSHIYLAEDHLFLDCEPERREALVKHLEKFIIMDDVTLEDETASLAGVALEGLRSEELARQALAIPLPTAEPNSHLEADGIGIFRSSVSGQPGLWTVTAPARKQEVIKKLEKAGAVPATAEDFRVARVENGVPRYGDDFSDSSIAHETQQMHAVSFTKGCYLGQEIVERVRSRGHVNRLLVALELEGETPPPPGSAVLFAGKEAGKMTSPVFSPRLQRVLGFALLRREAAVPGAEVRVDPLCGKVRQTPV